LIVMVSPANALRTNMGMTSASRIRGPNGMPYRKIVNGTP
jgi:hypothetical protein